MKVIMKPIRFIGGLLGLTSKDLPEIPIADTTV